MMVTLFSPDRAPVHCVLDGILRARSLVRPDGGMNDVVEGIRLKC